MSNKPAAADYLNQVSLLRFIVVLALVLSAHAANVPSWEIALVVGVLAWRALAALRQWRLPHWTIRTALTVGVFAGIAWSYNWRVFAQDPGTALLVAMAALKLVEMRSRRDVMVTVFLMYFILLTHFLYSQEIWTVFYLFACVVAITTLLVDVNHAGSPLPLRTASGVGSRLVAVSLPVMLILFVLFPRIPGPLWGLPSEAGGSSTGISEEMSPGDISKLAKSEDVAFRVVFSGPVPPRGKLYWRGPVMSEFDGRRWSQTYGLPMTRVPAIEAAGGAFDYEITVEPHSGRWLFALDLPSPQAGLPPETRLTGAAQLVAQRPVINRLLYTLRSYTAYRLEPELGKASRLRNLYVPKSRNLRTQALAREWRDAGLTDVQVIQAALTRFREQPYIYTLEPPALGADSVDEFLFDTLQGFCEHYASAFALLMRAAGIPARIVAGYHGAEFNDVGGYHVVRQSDAHAWTEVWLQERGWVRVDPTTAIAPERVRTDTAETLAAGAGGELSLERMKIWAEARFDWLNAQWNRWVLGFGPELQRDLMRLLGIVDWGQMILLLTVLVTGVLALVNLSFLRRFMPVATRDEAQRQWWRALRLLRRRGASPRPGEGPRDFVARLGADHPDLAAPMQDVLRAYLRVRYLEEPAPALRKELVEAVGRLKTA